MDQEKLEREFLDACESGDLEKVQKCVGWGINTEAQCKGLTLTDSYEVAKFLIDEGVDFTDGEPSAKLLDRMRDNVGRGLCSTPLVGQPRAVGEALLSLLPKGVALFFSIVFCDEILFFRALHGDYKPQKEHVPWVKGLETIECFKGFEKDPLLMVYGSYKMSHNPTFIKMYDGLVKKGYTHVGKYDSEMLEFFESRKLKVEVTQIRDDCSTILEKMSVLVDAISNTRP